MDVESLKLRQKDCAGEFIQARGSEGFSEGKSAGYEKEKVQPVLVIRAFRYLQFHLLAEMDLQPANQYSRCFR